MSEKLTHSREITHLSRKGRISKCHPQSFNGDITGMSTLKWYCNIKKKIPTKCWLFYMLSHFALSANMVIVSKAKLHFILPISPPSCMFPKWHG